MSKGVALVTGGSRGIGRGICLALAQAGWTVAVNYRSNQDAANQTVKRIKELGSKGAAFQADIGKLDDHDRLVMDVVSAFGQINLLVNNAGIAPPTRLPILETTEASYDQVMETNLKGPFFLTQRVINTMIKQGATPTGTVVNIGSISAYTSSPNRAEYCLSKAGMGMMTMLYADAAADYGIGVYEIRPGIIQTDMTSVVKEKYDRLILDEGLTPIQRWGQPEDIGRAVATIADGAFPFSTGEIINVDGGFHMKRL